MSAESLMEASEDLFSLEQIRAVIETDSTLIFEAITSELEVYLPRESDDADLTDGGFDFLTSLADQVLGEFEELLDSDSDKKLFLTVENIRLASKHKSQQCRRNNKNT